MDAAQDFFAERAGCKPSSLAKDESIFKCYLLPYFGDKTLSEITGSAIRKFQAYLRGIESRGRPLSASRINTVLQPLFAILKDAEADGLITHKPLVRVKRLPEPKPEIDPLSEVFSQSRW